MSGYEVYGKPSFSARLRNRRVRFCFRSREAHATRDHFRTPSGVITGLRAKFRELRFVQLPVIPDHSGVIRLTRHKLSCITDSYRYRQLTLFACEHAPS